MKYLDEFRDPKAVLNIAKQIKHITTRAWTIMEVCGGQTHTIVKYGLEQLLPADITLIHGPGCPVCVTPINIIDRAIAIAQEKGVIFCTFGDMLRVPGSTSDLLSVKASGADVRIVYSPLEALQLAENNPEKTIVFLAIGFETTAPANAMAVFQAKLRGIVNFSVLVSHVLVPPALAFIMESNDNSVQGFLAAGHVCVIMGTEAYQQCCRQYQIPIVITGFEPLDIMRGIFACIQQLENGEASVDNQYERCVKHEGNVTAQDMITTVFKIVDQKWRGLGCIASSGLSLQDEYQMFDADQRFPKGSNNVSEASSQCYCGQVLQGRIRPLHCPEFAKTCTPESPLGAPMVSEEGACSAYFNYHQRQ